MPETYDIPDVEIFALGNHHGYEFTDAEVERMVADTNAIDGRAPYVGIGHDRKDGDPRAGTLANLRYQAGKVIADFMGVPKKVFDAIRAGGLPKRSVELVRDYRDKAGSVFPWIIDAVALLGSAHPEVKDLADIETLYAKEGARRLVIFTEAEWPDDQREAEMPKENPAEVEEREVDVTTAEAEAEEKETEEEAEDTTEMDGLREENEKLREEIKGLQSEKGDLGDRVRDLEEKDRNATVDAVMSELGSEGKVLPAEAGVIRADLTDKLASPRMLSFGEKTEDAYKATVAQLRAREPKVDFGEKTTGGPNPERGGPPTTESEYRAQRADEAKNEK